MELSAAVLTGGASRRMGMDKAMLDVGGKTLLERTLATLGELADDVTIVGARAEYAVYGAPMVTDDAPGGGALGGVATALRVARHDATLVVACDMPLLSIALLRAMAAEPRDYDVLLPVVMDTRVTSAAAVPTRLQPLHAIYLRRCLPHIVARLEAGQRSVTDALAALRVRRLDEHWMRRFDPQLGSTHNANTPAELDAARRLLEAKVGVAQDG